MARMALSLLWMNMKNRRRKEEQLTKMRPNLSLIHNRNCTIAIHGLYASGLQMFIIFLLNMMLLLLLLRCQYSLHSLDARRCFTGTVSAFQFNKLNWIYHFMILSGEVLCFWPIFHSFSSVHLGQRFNLLLGMHINCRACAEICCKYNKIAAMTWKISWAWTNENGCGHWHPHPSNAIQFDLFSV